jgi:hypothetical protein
MFKILLANLRFKCVLKSMGARCHNLCWKRRDSGLAFFHANGISPIQTMNADGDAVWVYASMGSDAGDCGRHSQSWDLAGFACMAALEGVWLWHQR